MDRTTLVIAASAAALLMFALGWAACWFWFHLRMAGAVRNDTLQRTRQAAEPDEQQVLDDLDRLEAEFAGEMARTPVARRQLFDRDVFDRPV